MAIQSSQVTSTNLSASRLSILLASYLKFLSTKPAIKDIFFSLQSNYLTDYQFDGIELYKFDNQGELALIEATGKPELVFRNIKRLTDVKAIIPEVTPSQSEPATRAIASLDRAFVFFPFASNVVVDGFLVHYRRDGIDLAAENLDFIGLFDATTCHHLAVSGSLGTSDSNIESNQLPHKNIAISPPQKQILAGMVDAKTNHELAQELGFSVSTIRHETMDIYQILGASDRKEAAQIALKLNLI
jgi:DNA-binding CsgD family transcriptional regulator